MERARSSDSQVLIVDDDDGLRAVIELVLEAEGYGVVSAMDGAQALGWLRRGVRPCLILLDLMMPGMNGWEFREAQRQDPALAEIPVVVLSGDGNLIEKAADLSVHGLLKKPVEIDVLIDTVARFCRRPAGPAA